MGKRALALLISFLAGPSALASTCIAHPNVYLPGINGRSMCAEKIENGEAILRDGNLVIRTSATNLYAKKPTEVVKDGAEGGEPPQAGEEGQGGKSNCPLCDALASRDKNYDVISDPDHQLGPSAPNPPPVNPQLPAPPPPVTSPQNSGPASGENAPGGGDSDPGSFDTGAGSGAWSGPSSSAPATSSPASSASTLAPSLGLPSSLAMNATPANSPSDDMRDIFPFNASFASSGRAPASDAPPNPDASESAALPSPSPDSAPAAPTRDPGSLHTLQAQDGTVPVASRYAGDSDPSDIETGCEESEAFMLPSGLTLKRLTSRDYRTIWKFIRSGRLSRDLASDDTHREWNSKLIRASRSFLAIDPYSPQAAMIRGDLLIFHPEQNETGKLYIVNAYDSSTLEITVQSFVNGRATGRETVLSLEDPNLADPSRERSLRPGFYALRMKKERVRVCSRAPLGHGTARGNAL